jgi:hypothetical protein
MRLLTQVETDRAASLSSLDIPIALLEITATGLTKSIMDATESVRRFLSGNGLHEFRTQSQGPEGKHLLATRFLRPDGSVVSTSTSLYRPKTKDGDPRIWIYGLRDHARPGDIIALALIGEDLWAFDLSSTPIDELAYKAGALSDALAVPFAEKTLVVDELTNLLLGVAEQGFIPAPGPGDTMVGRVLETALGIAANSKKAPDFHGIELKAFRLKKGFGNKHAMKRRNLFAKTPNWKASTLKSSREIVDEFGYFDDDGVKRLYCEVRSTRFNTQGLRFAVNENDDELREISNRPDLPEVVVWDLDRLRKELAAKHAETFWIGAESKTVDGKEWFRYITVEHTQQPLIEQFGPLVSNGHISMDHLIKRKGNGANEKGPLFKIDNSAATLLFPSPRHFSLLAPDASK